MLIGASGSWHPPAHRLAQVTDDRQPRDGAGWTPKGLEGALAPAVPRAGRPAPYRERAQIAHLTYGLGEPPSPHSYRLSDCVGLVFSSASDLPETKLRQAQ